MNTKKTLILTAASLALGAPFTSKAQWAVVDAGNIAQSTITATNAVKQTATQTLQYANQIRQLQYQIQGYIVQIKQATGIAALQQVWAAYQDTARQLQGVYQQYQALVGNNGGLQNFLANFQDVNYYTQNPGRVYQWNPTGSVTQKQANDTLVRGILMQQDQLQRDASTMEAMQQSARSVDTQLQAMEAANQYADLQAKQLLEIRAILLQEQQSMAVKMQTDADLAARQAAANQQFQQWNYTNGSGEKWAP